MTPTIHRCPNGEFLLKILDGERTVMTLVLTEAEARQIRDDFLQKTAELDEERGQ